MSSSLNLELNPFERSFAEKPKISSSSSSSIASLPIRHNSKPSTNPIKLGSSDSHPSHQTASSSSSASVNQIPNTVNNNPLATNLSPPVITLSSNSLTPGGSRRLPLPLSPNGVLNGSLTGISFTPGGFLSGLVNNSSTNAATNPAASVPTMNGAAINMNLNGIGSLNNIKTGFTPNESSVRTSSGLTPAWIAATSSSSSIFTPGFNSILGISSNTSSNSNGISLASDDAKSAPSNLSKDSTHFINGNKSSMATINETLNGRSKSASSSAINVIPSTIKSEFNSVIPASLSDSIPSNVVNKNINPVNPLPGFFPINSSISSNSVATSGSPLLTNNQTSQPNSKKRSISNDKKVANKLRKVKDASQTASPSTDYKITSDLTSAVKLENSASQVSGLSSNSNSLDSKSSSENCSEVNFVVDPKSSKGKSKTTPKPKKVRKEMSEEEKRQSFLERNRLAASKCRQRKKQHIEKMKEDLSYYSSQYNYLSNEVVNYNKAMAAIKEMLVLKSDPLISAVGLEYFERILLLTTMQDPNGNESSNSNNNPIPVSKIPHSMIVGQQVPASSNTNTGVGNTLSGIGVHGVANSNNSAAMLGSMISNTGLNHSSSNIAASNDSRNSISNHRNSNGGVFPRML